MPDPQKQPILEPFAPRAAFPDIYPLDEFYAERKLSLPVIGRVEADEIPEPYKSLLVHQDDMTPTLEKFHRHRIHIRVLSRHTFENEYFREVVLLLNGTKKPIEYGAIKIIIDLLPEAARKAVLEEHRPLGHVLSEFNVAHKSQPQMFFAVTSDAHINEALGLTGAHTLYARRNTILDPWDRPMAEIVEILPPQ
jgi:chorismate-pyruvate lyase